MVVVWTIPVLNFLQLAFICCGRGVFSAQCLKCSGVIRLHLFIARATLGAPLFQYFVASISDSHLPFLTWSTIVQNILAEAFLFSEYLYGKGAVDHDLKCCRAKNVCREVITGSHGKRKKEFHFFQQK